MKPDATLLSSALAGAGITPISLGEESHLGLVVRVEAADAVASLAALAASTELAFEMLLDTFGADTGEQVEVTYHLRSFAHNTDLYVKVRVPYGATLASAFDVYPSVYMPERELAEMFGLLLSGHPNPKRLLSTEVTPPLLLKSTAVRSREELWSE